MDRIDKDSLDHALGAIVLTGPAYGPADQDQPDPARVEEDTLLQALRVLGRVLGEIRKTTMGWGFDVRCPWDHDHSDRIDSGAFYVPLLERFQCQHGHCNDRTTGDARARIDELLREDSGGLECLASLEFDDVDPLTISPPTGSWKSRWQHTGKNGAGPPTSNAFNAMIALREAPELGQAFGFNEFTLREMLHRELPGVVPGTTPGVPREWRDQDTILLQCWLQGQGLRSIPSWVVDTAVNAVMHEKSYHPVRDWLESLAWDQVPRLDTWLACYLGTPQDPYHAHVGRWWLMTMCRRIFEPGCRADYMPVLEGPQGRGKSTALATLVGDPQWFSDSLPDIAGKDVSEHLTGRWLVEIAEMDKFDRAESNAMKAFVSRTAERYRRAYARRTMNEPRQCIFAGTVNHHSYLKDDTGNRRYWPIAVGQIDLVGLTNARDQLFAEAWSCAVIQQQAFSPDPVFEDLFIQPEQDARLEADPWEHLVVSYLLTKTRVLVNEVLVAVTGGGSLVMSTTNRNRVTRIMETLGWRRGQRGPNGERFWCSN